MKTTKHSPHIKRYIITSAQRGATVHHGFLDNLEAYARKKKAELMVIPLKGLSDEDELHPRLQKTFSVVTAEIHLSKKLFIAQFEIQAQKVNPLVGLNRHVQVESSAIVGSPKQFMKACPNAIMKLPKILLSTGICTDPLYKDSTAGRSAEREHTYGAIYVEVDTTTEKFHYRLFQANVAGAFSDLTVSVDEKRIKESRTEALILGDWHTGSVDAQVKERTYELIRRLKPKYLIVHDLFDGQSVNHHEKEKFVCRARKYEKLELEAELRACGEELIEMKKHLPKDSQIVIVKSNHDEFLSRWLDRTDYAQDVRNFRMGHLLAIDAFDGKDPLEEGIARAMKMRITGVRFLRRDEDFKVRGWQLGSHGDVGSNGARRATVMDLESALGPSITGHRHTPEIMRKVVVVGTSTELKLDYNSGPSSWMNTHAILTENAKPQLINIIEGSYEF